MDLYQILMVCGVSGIISGLVGVLIAVFLKRPLERRVEQQEQAQARQRNEARVTQEKLEAQNKATQLGVQALLRDRLLQAFDHYHSKGWASYDERENVHNMYTQYEALGPNSVMDHMYESFTSLPDHAPVVSGQVSVQSVQ